MQYWHLSAIVGIYHKQALRYMWLQFYYNADIFIAEMRSLLYNVMLS